MSVIVLLIAAGGLVASGFLLAFIWAVRAGQFDDVGTPPVRMLVDDLDAPARPHPADRGTIHVESRP
jgi:cbb3-type cytochrome oxidase maturation protein